MQENFLGTLFTSTSVIGETLDTIRKKYDIPEVLPENEQLTEMIRSNDFYDWQEIRDEIEKELRDKLKILPPELELIFQGIGEMTKKTNGINGLEGMTAEVTNPVLEKFTQVLLTNALQAMSFLDKVYKEAADRLLDHLVTGRPFEFPSILLNLVGTLNFPNGDDGEKVMIAVAHQLTDPDEMMEIFRAKIVETFGEKPKINKKSLETAEYLGMKYSDKSLNYLVELDMERHPEDYLPSKGSKISPKDMKKFKNTMRQRIYRLRQDINQIVGDKKW